MKHGSSKTCLRVLELLNSSTFCQSCWLRQKKHAVTPAGKKSAQNGLCCNSQYRLSLGSKSEVFFQGKERKRLAPFFSLLLFCLGSSTMQSRDDASRHKDFHEWCCPYRWYFFRCKGSASRSLQGCTELPQYFSSIFCCSKNGQPYGKKIFGQALPVGRFPCLLMKHRKKVTQR